MRVSAAQAALTGAAALLLLGCGSSTDAGQPASGDTVPFIVLDKTSNSGRTVTSRELAVALDRGDYDELWTEHVSTLVPAPAAPAVDLDTSTVIGVFDPSVGPIAIIDVTNTGDQVTVHATKTDTSKCPRVQVIESNAVIASVEVPADAGTSFDVDWVVEPADCP